MRFPLLYAVGRALVLIGMLVRFGLIVLGHAVRRGTLPVDFLGRELRRLCEALGITYVKFGQFLAMRFDVLPFAICRQLGELMENVAPMDFAVVRATVEEALGAPPESFFARFEPTCVAAASIAQVHQAWTLDGELVAVKVRRPRIEAIFRADTRNLRWVAWLADRLRLVPSAGLVEAVDEFAAFTLREMDFLTEARTAARLRDQAGAGEYVPRVRWDLTTAAVFTMEFVKGVSMGTLCQLFEEGREQGMGGGVPPCHKGGSRGDQRYQRVGEISPHLDLDAATRNLVRASLRQLFVSGFFHADLHPGNMLVRDDGTVAFVDFGIFSSLDPSRRRHCAGYVENIARRRFERAFRHYLHLVVLTPDSDLEGFRRDTIALMERWYRTARDPAAPVRERHMGTFWNDSFALFSRHGIRLDVEMTLFWRTLFLLDSTTLRLNREFDLLQTVEEFFAASRPLLAAGWVRELGDAEPAAALVGLARSLPDRLAAGRGLAAGSERPAARRRVGARRSTWQVFALVGLSCSILAGRVDFGPAAMSFLTAAGVLLIARAMVGMARR